MIETEGVRHELRVPVPASCSSAERDDHTADGCPAASSVHGYRVLGGKLVNRYDYLRETVGNADTTSGRVRIGAVREAAGNI